jgi:predicted Ser/Thr protein kinase
MKFQCEGCQGVVETDFADEYVSCGHCGSVCHVPSEMGSGVVIDDFVIIKLLGEGGMGYVYLAHQFSLDRHVALKILKSNFTANDKFKEDFIKESRSVASLNHPKIIQAYKVGEEDELLFFAMEYVEGQNLQDILKHEGALGELRVLDIAVDVVEALGYAWEKKKLVHRDIKPENIMITNDGMAKVMDLGLSCNAGDLNDDGDTISGTPQYISPEQILGDEIDIRTDFYCLGATLYHLLSGSYPFDGNLQEMVRKHIQESPASLKKKCPELSGYTVKIIHKLMSKDPNERPASAAILLKEIKHSKKHLLDHAHGKTHFAVRKGEDGKVTSVTTATQRMRRPKKKTHTIPIVICAVLVLFVGTFFLIKSLVTARSIESKAADVVSTVGSKAVDLTNVEAPETEFLPGLNYRVYEKEVKSFSGLEKIKPNFMGRTVSLTVDGLKGRPLNVAYVFDGYVNLPYSDQYYFHLDADDYCTVEIDNKLVISHTYGKPKAREKISLQKGMHKIKVSFAQWTGLKALKLYIESISVNKKLLPQDWLLHKPELTPKGFDLVTPEKIESKSKIVDDVRPIAKSTAEVSRYQKGLFCQAYSGKDLYLKKASKRKYTETFFLPQMFAHSRKENIVYSGFLKIDEDAICTFNLKSGKEGILYIDGEKVAYSKGNKLNTAKRTLKKGFHPFELFCKRLAKIGTFQVKVGEKEFGPAGDGLFYRTQKLKISARYYKGKGAYELNSKPSREKTLETISLSSAPYKQGFGMRLQGSLYFSQAQKYTFVMKATGKATLGIDKNKALFLEAEATGEKGISVTKLMKVGIHSYELNYYQDKKGEDLSVEIYANGKKVGDLIDFVVQ